MFVTYLPRMRTGYLAPRHLSRFGDVFAPNNQPEYVSLLVEFSRKSTPTWANTFCTCIPTPNRPGVFIETWSIPANSKSTDSFRVRH